jgi:hypothetical protein
MMLLLAGLMDSLVQWTSDTVCPFIDEICGFVARM